MLCYSAFVDNPPNAGSVFNFQSGSYNLLLQGVQPCTGTLQDIMGKGRPCYKARLLHYFADPECGSKGPGAQLAWCGWHTDHSSLTGEYSQDLSNAESSCFEHIRRRDLPVSDRLILLVCNAEDGSSHACICSLMM